MLRRLLFGLAALVALSVPLAAGADTVASLLGDFTINQFCAVGLDGSAVRVHYVVVFGQLPALRELHEADADGDGVTSQNERDAYARAAAAGIAQRLQLTVDGAPVPLSPGGVTTSLPAEQTGFSMRWDIDFAAPLPRARADAPHALAFDNRNWPDRIGWHEITVEPERGIAVFDTNAFSTSATGGLSQALKVLPDTGALDERAIRLQFLEGTAPRGAHLLPTRDGATAVPAPAPPAGESGWLPLQTRRLVDLISAPAVPPGVLALALLLAAALGALHAFSPGHGKTIVGAYLIGSRGTTRHALILGITVTITHTLVVFAIGLATLVASRYVLPERLFPVLSLASGALVLGMGIVLFGQRWRIAHRALVGHLSGEAPHGHDHGHAHAHGARTHSHGGRAHSHLPPGDVPTWRGLLALGISGGLLPCPSAMVLLLAAVALQKTFYGLLLTVAFSLGLAATLTGVGLAFIQARRRLGERFGDRLQAHGWTHVLPLGSALLITVVGAVLCYGAIAGRAI